MSPGDPYRSECMGCSALSDEVTELKEELEEKKKAARKRWFNRGVSIIIAGMLVSGGVLGHGCARGYAMRPEPVTPAAPPPEPPPPCQNTASVAKYGHALILCEKDHTLAVEPLNSDEAIVRCICKSQEKPANEGKPQIP